MAFEDASLATLHAAAPSAKPNIINNPGEKQNVVAQHPDIVRKLSAQVAAWVDTLPKSYVKTDDKDR